MYNVAGAASGLGMQRRTDPLAALMNPARHSYICAHNPRLLTLGSLENEYPDRASWRRATAGPWRSHTFDSRHSPR
jgi:hypothetical protein